MYQIIPMFVKTYVMDSILFVIYTFVTFLNLLSACYCSYLAVEDIKDRNVPWVWFIVISANLALVVSYLFNVFG